MGNSVQRPIFPTVRDTRWVFSRSAFRRLTRSQLLESCAVRQESTSLKGKQPAKRFHFGISAGESGCPEVLYREQFYLHGSADAHGKPWLPSVEVGAGVGSQRFPHTSIISHKYAATPFLGNELETHRKTKEGS